MRLARSFVVVVVLLLGIGAEAFGAASPWAETDHTAVRLITATERTGEGSEISAGLHFRMKPHWKIYWRAPGDAGFPPSIDWEGSDNLTAGEIRWPAPERFSVLGFETMGYEDEVVLPLVLRPERAGETVAMKAAVDYLACAEICIPYRGEVALTLPGGPADPGAEAHLIAQWSARVPGDGSALGLEFSKLEAAGGRLRLSATSSLQPFASPDVFVEGPLELIFSKPEVRLEDGGKRAVLDLPVDGIADLAGGWEGRALTLTLVDGSRAAEWTAEPAVLESLPPLAGAAPAAQEEAEPLPLLPILALAVLGGLILNLMPCVLPVLSIKLIGVIGHGGGDPREVRISFLATAAGILFSFMVLAGALAGLKAAGAAVGWGIQFQQPWFLIAMALIVALFACNLWGLFEFHLPHAIADVGEKSSHIHGLGGHFFTGAFATLMATPCSAPFLGTAVGFALSRGTAEIMAVFAALGVGLAVPYLLFAVFPSLATRMPKPGAWMVYLKKVMAFALFVTGIWLLSVLDTQLGSAGAAMVSGMMLTLTIGFWVRQALPRIKRVGAVMVVAGAVGGFLVPPLAPTPSAEANPDPAVLKGLWKPFDEAAIPKLVGLGKTVFVDVTADWCVTCQVNKKLVLSQGEARALLTGPDVIAMKADWTQPDDSIAAFLARFGRYGIPFNAVWGPGAPDGVVLSELLSQSEVVEAFGAAQGAK